MKEQDYDYFDFQSLDPAEVAFYNLTRLRTDNWHFLRDNARRLHRLHKSGTVQEQADVMWLTDACTEVFSFLQPLEEFFVFPGIPALEQVKAAFEQRRYDDFARQIVRMVRMMTNGLFRKLDLTTSRLSDYGDLLNVAKLSDELHTRIRQEKRPYFQVLIVDDLTETESKEVRRQLRDLRRPDDLFFYEVVVARSYEDALLAALINPDIQTCVVRYSFPFRSKKKFRLLDELHSLLKHNVKKLDSAMPTERSLALGKSLKSLRPELDLYLVTDAPVESIVGEPSRAFRRAFYNQGNYQEMHLSILKAVNERYETPFFNALKKYSQKPTAMFHALPISHSATIVRSHWIKDMGEFYGSKMFEAETSATTGGLDSLLQPGGSLRDSQENASRAFGSRRTYFVTNGTSTANKIVMQAINRPGDIVLLAHDCHKSHPYACILSGAFPVYLDAYPLSEYSMYGAVPLREIKSRLLELRAAGKLDQVRMLLLTNITFDGIVYDPIRVMEEVLAIKPDMIFLWDEAWCAYARFSPILRRRTAMWSAQELRQRFDSSAYLKKFAKWKTQFEASNTSDDETWLETRLMPDPELARVRVYATHSTHKTLTALRQGSMIHVHDQDFEHYTRNAFNEAYMTHTSTSPNYQILASLDVGRRQVELEGHDMVGRSIELAMMLRERITRDPLISKFFTVLAAKEMILPEFRPSGLEEYFSNSAGWCRLDKAWLGDEFVLDPTRVTLHVGSTGMDGDTFKKLLMDRFDIQINKTSRNTVLFMIHIGMTRGTIAHLVNVLSEIAMDLNDKLDSWSNVELAAHEQNVRSLNEELPPLPNFSRFHPSFLPSPENTTPEGDMRRAFYLAYDDTACEHIKIEDGSLLEAVQAGDRDIVSAAFITPYPPGFPVLVPGQVVTREIVQYLMALDVQEIHGYEPMYGTRVFKTSAVVRESEKQDALLISNRSGSC
ncbi:aminotransferase class I/II-fold pyridoxal phosphate-dependent enzyme [Rubripirellula reticaptiva]|uniref:Lysine decarboxylase, constitutive n=1 Tax=Rubripirellula reticaptiva TaxID=2528013 RepID=A0A5C6EHM7_9BACT|nr:ornithine decarboxylase [Rubripirellula reticaptiva]TWU48050.1 Lysine decarboxylase, constitutive [Rubripirellula reticaptiva]